MVCGMSTPFVSLVIPVLDDTEALARVLPAIETCSAVEILVVSGRPPDARLTALTDLRNDVRLLSSAPGRGRQMNAGACDARGRWLLFLHADSRLPSAWLDELHRADQDPSIVGGSFRFRLDALAWQARLIERGVRLRVRWFGLAYGDQGLFVRREVFLAIGGYREWPLMEDVDLVRRLGRAGRLYHSARPLVTSARRWERDGWWRRSAHNLALQALFFAGVSPAWLAHRYGQPLARRAVRVALVMMARAPSDARGKTRLTRELGGDHVGLKRALLLDTIDAVRQVQHADLFLAFEPPEAAGEIGSLTGGAAQLLAQRGDTLGERMHHAFASLFARGYSSVVMVGSDLPTLPPAYVVQAFTRLRDGSVVIGPAVDGGYYLIGLRAPSPALFTSIPWSTRDALSTTLAAAEREGLPVSLTPEWYDVDDRDDLRRLMNEPAGGERTRSWVAAHPDVMSV